MAQPWERDWSKPQGADMADDSTPPWERKWGAAPAAKPKQQDGQAVSGFKRSFQEVPGMLAGVGAFAAASQPRPRPVTPTCARCSTCCARPRAGAPVAA